MADDSVHPNELNEISARLKFRQWVGLVAAAALVIWMVVFAHLASGLTSSTNHTGELALRGDCKTEYNSILAGPIQTRDNLTSQVTSLGADLNSQLGAALLGVEQGQQPSQAVVTTYAATKAQLDMTRLALRAAIIAVNQEPTLNAATNNGFGFAGHRYPACPKVH